MEKIIVCVCVCVNSSLGRCCPCEKKDEENIEKASTLLSKNETRNIIDNTGATNAITNDFGEELNTENNNEGTNEDEPGPYYYKVIRDTGDVAKDCFGSHWYTVNKSSVIRLKSIKEEEYSDEWEVTGNGNMWNIVCNKETDDLNNKICNPEKQTWIIFKITTLNPITKKAGNSYTFYVDDISLWEGELNIDGYTHKGQRRSAFGGVKCYTWTLLHANTANVKNFADLFKHFSSVLEKDEKTNLSGLKGLEKLNVTNARNISEMFFCAIYKQNTLSQLSKWKFGDDSINITKLFHSSSSKELDFHALDGWATNCNNENTKFVISVARTEENKKEIFFSSLHPDVKNFPAWFANIG